MGFWLSNRPMELRTVFEPCDQGGYTVFIPALPWCIPRETRYKRRAKISGNPPPSTSNLAKILRFWREESLRRSHFEGNPLSERLPWLQATANDMRNSCLSPRAPLTSRDILNAGCDIQGHSSVPFFACQSFLADRSH